MLSMYKQEQSLLGTYQQLTINLGELKQKILSFPYIKGVTEKTDRTTDYKNLKRVSSMLIYIPHWTIRHTLVHMKTK